ncbi:MAG TPA: hypothetical protein PK466_03250 [Thermotogota bacterium]|nr:hypothetical protein [Thermotogota bacterium]
MDSKTKAIIENEMVISEIEKKWNCTTDRAVQLFCKALGLKKPNTDKLDAWSKNKLKKMHTGQAKCCSDSQQSESQSCSCSSSSCSGCHGSCH